MSLSQPKQQAGLVAERSGREIVIYRAGAPGGTIFSLNPTAALVWDLCDGAHTLDDIELAVRGSFAVAAQHPVAADVAETVASFRAHGLLEAEP